MKPKQKPPVYVCCCAPQAESIIEDGSAGGTSEQRTVAFTDEVIGDSEGWTGTTSSISAADETKGMGLASFLSRPVRIANFTWNESDAVGTTTTIRPWNLFFSDAAIKNKLTNFAFLQCDLKVKVLINASPFYAGRMFAFYLPLPAITPSTIQIPAGSGTKYFIPLSQRHIQLEINPTTSQGGELCLPWFYHKNWLDIQSNQDTIDMGQLDFVNFTTLTSANGATGVGVSIQVFAWAENIRLSGPSVGLPLQGGDEYGTGVVSAPASAIASAASWFEDIPIIGTFATATRIGASAVSAIASLFGWTNVPVITDCQPYRPSAFPQLASTTIGFPAEKLTVDPKNELSVDPRIMGMDGKDEMVLKGILSRDSYLCTLNWSNTNNVDDILFTSLVTPLLQDVYTDTGSNNALFMIPVAWVSHLFKHWRGDLIFRFKFVATPYHKGRVRISFDPSGSAANNLINTTSTYSTLKTHIVDLGEEQDIELRIPYQQATSFQQVQNSYTAVNWNTTTSPSFTRNKVFDNGTIVMRVQTALTSAIATAAVPILVYVRAADNFEFANPDNLASSVTTFAPQGDTVMEPASEILGTSVPEYNPDRNLVHFGEVVMSLRSLLRRQSLNIVTVPTAGTGSEVHYVFKERISRFPMPFGWDAAGIHTANKQLTVGTAPFNFAFLTPFNYIIPAYVGLRGSMQCTINAQGNGPIAHMRVYRHTNSSGTASVTTLSQTAIGSFSSASRFYVSNLDGGSSGQALTNQNTNAGLTVQFPNYTKYKFESTYPASINNAPTSTGMDIDCHVIETSYTPATPYTNGPTISNVNTKLWRYFGIGTDFNVHWFLNVPVYWAYNSMPTAV